MLVRNYVMVWGCLAFLPVGGLWADAEADYQRLKPQLSARAGNAAYDAELGIAALDSGRTAEAIAAFERVLAVEPDNHAIRTELARAYDRVGDKVAARREVSAVASSPAVPRAVRANLSNYVSALDDDMTGGPITLNGYIHTSAGYDSNVNTATDSSYLLVPALSFLGPARLDSGLNAEEDWFGEVENGNILRVPYAPGSQFFLSNRVNRRQMKDASTFNQMSAGGELGWQSESIDYGVLSVGLSGQGIWFGDDVYSVSGGVYGAWRKPLDEVSAFTLYGNYGHTKYAEQPDKDANRVVVGATYQRALPGRWQPTAFVGGYGGFDETVNGNADYWSHKVAGITSGIEAYPRETTSVFAEANYEIRDYSDDYPLFMRARFDRQADVAVGVNQALFGKTSDKWWGGSISVRPKVAWRNTESNVGLYDYSRWVGEVQLRYSY